ncbi:MAG: hypothetical protein JO243_10665 [Solirubrobacterales bacterium]|nr:hypothetical protein [Solirubrobacterales bacterium]
MSATTITTTQPTTSTQPKRTFKRRYTVAQGNAVQAGGMAGGAALLGMASAISGPGILRAGLMLVGFVAVYLNCHAIAHYIAGRLVGLKFRGYGVRGTDHPDVYPPGIRQLMQAAPFYVTLSTRASREHAGRGAKAVYFRRWRDLDGRLLHRVRRSRRRRSRPGWPATPHRDDRLQRDQHHRHRPHSQRRLRESHPRRAQLAANASSPAKARPGKAGALGEQREAAVKYAEMSSSAASARALLTS